MILHIAVVVAALLLGKLRVATCLVYDPVEDKDFCPKNGCSPPSSHYVCKYFDSKKPKNKRICESYPMLVTFNEKNAATIVHDINRFRANLSQGLAVKRGGKPIPRGYGIMRMSWDKQLAGLAKFYTETCIGSKLCASTRKFPKVTYEFYTRSNTNMEDGNKAAGLLEYELTYQLKLYNPGQPYFVSMLGDAKYLGCAAALSKNKNKPNYASELVCFLSHHTEHGEPTYNTTPPQLETGFTNMCGCPLFHREVEGCLCEYYAPHTVSTPPVYDFQKYANKRLRGPTEPRARVWTPARGLAPRRRPSTPAEPPAERPAGGQAPRPSAPPTAEPPAERPAGGQAPRPSAPPTAEPPGRASRRRPSTTAEPPAGGRAPRPSALPAA